MEEQSRRTKLTKTVVSGARPGAVEYVIWDTIVPGFGLRVRPTGARSFVFNYRTPGGRAGKKRRVTLKADHPDIARAEAKALAGQHFSGSDPAADLAARRHQSEGPKVRDLLDRFLLEHADRVLKPKTALEYRRLVGRLLEPCLGDLLVADVTTADVAASHQRWRDRPTQAAAAVRVLSSAFSLAEEWGLRPAGSNPARIRLKGARRRERLFRDAEVARMLRALGELVDAGRITPPAGFAIRFLFATGCRAGEVLDLRWEYVDLAAGVLRWPDSKTGAMVKPITDETAALLAGADRFVGVPWVAPGPSMSRMRIEYLADSFRKVMSAAGVEAGENATLHLIRHWFASTIYSDPAIPLPLAMRITGHSAVATAMRYAHATRDQVFYAAAGAAERRADAIRRAGAGAEIVPIKGGR